MCASSFNVHPLQGEGQLLGDVMVLLRAVGACEYAPSRSEEFCLQSGLRWKAVQEVRKLRRQLTNTVNAISPESEVTFDPGLAPPTAEQVRRKPCDTDILYIYAVACGVLL